MTERYPRYPDGYVIRLGWVAGLVAVRLSLDGSRFFTCATRLPEPILFEVD